MRNRTVGGFRSLNAWTAEPSGETMVEAIGLDHP